MPMQKKCCIDSCVWIKYAGHFKTATLLRYISENNLLIYADDKHNSEQNVEECDAIGMPWKTKAGLIKKNTKYCSH